MAKQHQWDYKCKKISIWNRTPKEREKKGQTISVQDNQIIYLANPKSAIFKTALLSFLDNRRFCSKTINITKRIYSQNTSQHGQDQFISKVVFQHEEFIFQCMSTNIYNFMTTNNMVQKHTQFREKKGTISYMKLLFDYNYRKKIQLLEQACFCTYMHK